MRNILIILFSLTFGIASSWQGINSTTASKSKIEVASSNIETTNIQFNIDGFHLIPVITPGGEMHLARLSDGASLLEAGAKRLPLISTDSPGCREVIRDGYNGYLVNVKDQIELAQRMYELSLDENKRKQMGLNSRKLIEEEYDVKIINKKTIELYNVTD